MKVKLCILVVSALVQLSLGQVFKAPIGTGCLISEHCVPHSDCVGQVCRCKPGFVELSSLECKMDYEGQCYSDRECNTAMGLRCAHGRCLCSQGTEYLPELGSCTNSSMKAMYQDAMELVNTTEFEIKRFTTLLNLFMIQSATPQSDNEVQVSASDINPIVYQRLQRLEHQLFAAQSPILSIVEAPSPDGNNGINEINLNDILPIPDVRDQMEAPQTTTTITDNNNNDGGGNLQTTTQNPFNLPTLNETLRSLQNLGLGLFRQGSGGFGNLVAPILPATRPQTSNPPNPFNLLPSLFGAGRGVGGGAAGGQAGGDPTNPMGLLPNLLRAFQQFLPVVQSFNRVLSNTILNVRRLQQQALQAALRTGPPTGTTGGGAGGTPATDDPSQGLLSLPFRLLQLPGRIFVTLFGPNSTFGQLTQRLFPPIDFNERPIRFLPWPLG